LFHVKKVNVKTQHGKSLNYTENVTKEIPGLNWTVWISAKHRAKNPS